MSSEFLDSFIENSASDIEDTIPDLLANKDLKSASQLSFYYRQHGCCQYLLTGNAEIFSGCLHRSAGCYLFFLQNGQEGDKQTSEIEPIFDAIGGGVMDAVYEIAKYSRTSHNSDFEYEDDFLYAHFILSYFFRKNGRDEIDCKKILEDYENVLEGVDDVRFELCKSFYDRESEVFIEKFEQFLDEREAKLNEMIQREVIGEDIWSWAKYISIEGLALLRLAETLRFKLDTNYTQIPEGLRHIPQVPFDSNLWMQT